MKSAEILLAWFLLALMTNVIISSPTLQDVKDVCTHIFNGYDNRIRPVINQSDVLRVSMIFLLSSINEFDEKSQRLVISGWFSISWVDESLAWRTYDFGNVSHVYVDGSSIWQPNIALINTFGRLNMLSRLASTAVINASGKVQWFPADSFVVTCKVDITYYPFDTQTCHLEFEIWNNLASEVAIVTTPESINIKYFEENVEWALVNSEIDSAELDHEYNSFVTYSFRLQRRPKFVILTIISPVILLAFLNVCVFLIPLSSGEKNSFCVTVYLSYAVFLGIISSELPHSSIHVSYLTVYLLALLIFSVIIVLITVIQVRLYIECGQTPAPAYVSKVLRCCTLGKQSKVSSLDIKDSDDVSDISVQSLKVKETYGNETGVCMKDVLPRLDVPLFCLFLLILFVMTSFMGGVAFAQAQVV